jgi:hypothetical protein
MLIICSKFNNHPILMNIVSLGCIIKLNLVLKLRVLNGGGISKMGPLTLAQLAKIDLALKVGI